MLRMLMNTVLKGTVKISKDTVILEDDFYVIGNTFIFTPKEASDTMMKLFLINYSVNDRQKEEEAVEVFKQYLKLCEDASEVFLMISDEMANLLLNTSAKIPAFGLGTWQSKPGEVGAAVEVALKAGYRHIDCAHIYGNEAEIGETLQKCFREGVVKREEVFVTSKLWNADHASEDVEPACKLTLKNLQLEYLDLYLVHSPSSLAIGTVQLTEDCMLGYDPARMAKTWKAMEGLVEKGLVKAIGISNFTITKTENLLKTAKIVPAVNQVECHPYFQQPKLKAYCDSKGIIFEVYAPLGSPSRVRKQDSDPDPLDDPVIKEISNKHSATVGQICIAFQLHRGLVVIPKSVNPDRIRENLKATEVKLDTEDLQRLKALDKNLRFFVGTFFVKKSVTIEEIWDVAADANFVLTLSEGCCMECKDEHRSHDSCLWTGVLNMKQACNNPGIIKGSGLLCHNV
eukprot:Em0008g10a